MRVAVVRALPGLGDLLCTVPALRALRRAHPAAHVTVIGLPAARFLRDRYPQYVDEVLDFPGWPGLPELPVDPAAIVAWLGEAQARDFDLALQLHGSGGASNPFAVMLGARRTAGFVDDAAWRPGADFLPWVEAEPESSRLVRLLDELGIAPAAGEALEFPVTDADRAEIAVEGPYACIHPGASIPERRWDATAFAAVAEGLRARGLHVVATGTRAERELCDRVGPDVNAAGRTSLGGVAALLCGARVTVCNDTGVSHLAAAVHAPSVIVFGRADPARWAPLDRERHRVVTPPATPKAVLGEVDALLSRLPATP